MYTFFYVTFNYMPYLKFKRFFPSVVESGSGGENLIDRGKMGGGGGNFLIDKP